MSWFETGYRENVHEGGGHDIVPYTWSRELMETPNMYIFLKSSDRALSRDTHFSYASSPQLGAPGAGSWCLPESEHRLCTKCRNWAFLKVQKHLWGCFGHPKVFFDHTFQIWTDLVKILRGFSSFWLISISEDLRAVSCYIEICSTSFLLIFVNLISKMVFDRIFTSQRP